MGTKALELRAICEYCGKRLVVQDEQGRSTDGNRVGLEVDGSQKRACRSCANGFSMALTDRMPQKPRCIGSQKGASWEMRIRF